MIDWISICAAVICTLGAVICTCCTVLCFRMARRKDAVPASRDYVQPSQPWPKPRPAMAVPPMHTPASVVEEADDEPEIRPATAAEDALRPYCQGCGEKMDGPVRMDLKGEASVYVFCCACGQEQDVPV